MPSPVPPLGMRTAPFFTSMSFCACPRKLQRSAKTLGSEKSSSKIGTEKSETGPRGARTAPPSVAASASSFGPASSGMSVALA